MLFCDDDISCHFERSEKSKEFKIRFVFGYFACAQYDKIYDTKSVWYGKTSQYDKFISMTNKP